MLEAEDGEGAIEACREKLPDAILFDWNMPKMDGYDSCGCCGGCRRQPAEGGVPTTENDVAHIVRACSRRQRIHDGAVRQGHRGSQVPGSRPDLGEGVQRRRRSPAIGLGRPHVASRVPSERDEHRPCRREPGDRRQQADFGVIVVDDLIVVRSLLTRSIEAEPDMAMPAPCAPGGGGRRPRTLQSPRSHSRRRYAGLETAFRAATAPAEETRPGRDMASTLTRRGAEVRLKALSLWAPPDYVPKPQWMPRRQWRSIASRSRRSARLGRRGRTVARQWSPGIAAEQTAPAARR